MKLATLRVLSIVGKHSKTGISTRLLLEELKANEFHRVIREAEAEGLVRREKVRKPKGQKGNFLMLNFLTPEGQKVVETAVALGLVVA